MRYWIGVASHDHVQRGVSGSYCQLCHGKPQPLKRMSICDWLIYYSPKTSFENGSPCQQFTAIGEVTGSHVYEFEMFPGFIPFRRDIQFHDCRNTDIRPLVPQLSFIGDKRHWGYAFRYGHIEIPRVDFELIATHMLGSAPRRLERQFELGI